MNPAAIQILTANDPFPALLGDAATWRRSYGRVDGKGRAVLLYDRSGGRPDTRAVMLTNGPDATSGIGAFTIAHWADDPLLPALRDVARRWPDAVPVRYRPGKRCTLFLPRGGGLFIKALADDRGAGIAADARLLWQAAGAGALDFRVARPVGWLPGAKLLVQHKLAGSGVASLLHSHSARLPCVSAPHFCAAPKPRPTQPGPIALPIWSLKTPHLRAPSQAASGAALRLIT